MTSAQTMLTGSEGLGGAARSFAGVIARIVVGLACWAALFSAVPGCASRPELVPPGVTVSPYAADAALAVIPLRNESGASFIDSDAVTDKVIAELSQVRGLTCLPLNRTIEAMRALNLPAVTTAIEAQQVANAMGVDGIIAGTITAYDPYDPPVLGLSLALYAQPSLGGNGGGPLDDPRLLSFQATDSGYTGGSSDEPASVESVHLDARSHDVLLALRQYAEGRTEARSALDWRVYTASMDLYTNFGAHEAVRGLLDREWLRLARFGRAQD